MVYCLFGGAGIENLKDIFSPHDNECQRFHNDVDHPSCHGQCHAQGGSQWLRETTGAIQQHTVQSHNGGGEDQDGEDEKGLRGSSG